MRTLSLLLLFPCAAWAFDCPPAQRVKFEPAAWKAALASDPAAALQQLGLAPLPAASCALEGVDLFAVNLTGSPQPDQILQARFGCGEVKAVRIAPLAAFAPGEVCRLEAKLDLDGPGCALQKLPRTFAFKSVVDPQRKALVLRDCDGATSVWDAQWAVLKKVAAGHGAIELGKKGWPRPLTVDGAPYRWHDSPVSGYLPR